MRHGVHKVKFTQGRDSHQALMRKLVLNFIRHGKIETTLPKARALKSAIDRLTGKAIRNSSSDQVMLMKYLGQKSAVNLMVEKIAPTFTNRKTGFTTMKKLGMRQGDAAEIVRMEWVEKVAVVDAPVAKATTKAAEAIAQSDKKGKTEVAARSKVTQEKSTRKAEAAPHVATKQTRGKVIP